ncbi:hypothetical protein WICANDRAFT_78670 [Wickerhamomyces anomalus NRRL Y-366-8]|uniref:Uncharacterized protein n=1 Tax=Wickerhamomyces anomalus (strain ATCC 58044 / CBS 1984 / NCYC 433 / NRRL Y-366-8) TaxID=683960 RepID=A0A1E3P424_WICAA|nr:uncharacterized protein WICANDRAFT_78670 [Wickerhamomyces anomalus NRRL Y-366-8]ODQ60048.1 hypothetical protein WICANDRAFT_78670 [Wickerhamomyces anomalus NRRL Y-366-8]
MFKSGVRITKYHQRLYAHGRLSIQLQRKYLLNTPASGSCALFSSSQTNVGNSQASTSYNTGRSESLGDNTDSQLLELDPPFLHYNEFLQTDEHGITTLETFSEYFDLTFGLFRIGFKEKIPVELIPKILMSSPSPASGYWKFPKPVQGKKEHHASLVLPKRFRRINQIEIEEFDQREIERGISKEFNKLNEFFNIKCSIMTKQKVFQVLSNIADANVSHLIDGPESESGIKTMCLKYIFGPVLQIINLINRPSILLKLTEQEPTCHKRADLTIKNCGSGSSCILEFERSLPSVHDIRKMEPTEILEIEGFEQTIQSIISSNTTLGILTSYKTTIIIEMDWDKCWFDHDTCKLKLRMLSIDNDQPLMTLKGILIYFLSKHLVYNSSAEKKRKLRDLVEWARREHILNLSYEERQKHYHELCESFVSECSPKEMINIELNFQEDQSLKFMESDISDMEKELNFFQLQKRHFPKDLMDVNDKGDDLVFVKLFNPISFPLGEDAFENQAILEEKYSYELYQLKQLQETESRKQLSLSNFKLWKSGFVQIRNEKSQLLCVGEMMAFVHKGSDIENSKPLPLMTKSDMLSQALGKLERYHQEGFGLGEYLEVEPIVALHNGEISLLGSKNYKGEVPYDRRIFERQVLKQCIDDGEILEL